MSTLYNKAFVYRDGQNVLNIDVLIHQNFKH